jgi:hypothetical protein
VSDLNHQLRPYQAENSEYNNEFVRNYIEHVSSPAAGDGRIPDPDSTFGRFIGWTLNRSLPPVQASDATIRIGLPWHAALPELCLRSTIEFTFVYALCLAAYHIDAKGALIVVAWCISSQLLLGAVQNFAGQDSSLFFDSIARSWRSFCWVPLVALFATSGGMAVIMAVLFGLLLDTVVSFPFASGAKEAVKRAYRLVVVVLLAATFGCLIENPARLELGIRVLFLLANFALMLPLVWGMQHWFAANRYTSLSDVQGYGQEAVFYGTVFKFGSSPRGAAGLWVARKLSPAA